MTEAGDARVGATGNRQAERVLRALRISGRHLAEIGPGRWGVLTGNDRRRRPAVVIAGDEVARLLAAGQLQRIADGACLLADLPPAAPSPSVSAWSLIPASHPRRGTRHARGFVGLAVLARRGQGPLSLRHVKAGLRLVADAEEAASGPGLTMDWSAGPITRRRRGPGGGGQTAAAAGASARLRRVRGLAGEAAWRLAWLACVEGATLVTMKQRTGFTQRQIGRALADALEQVASAYER